VALPDALLKMPSVEPLAEQLEKNGIADMYALKSLLGDTAQAWASVGLNYGQIVALRKAVNDLSS